MTNPVGARVAQWKNIPLKYGVASFDLHIAEAFVPVRVPDGRVLSCFLMFNVD